MVITSLYEFPPDMTSALCAVPGKLRHVHHVAAAQDGGRGVEVGAAHQEHWSC